MADDHIMQRRYDLGTAIYQRRKTRGLTQDELAEIIGFDRKSINRVENGAHAITIDRLWLIADALQVSLGDLAADAADIAKKRLRPPEPGPPDRTTRPK